MIINDIKDPQEEALDRVLQGCDLILDVVREHSLSDLAALLGSRNEEDLAFAWIDTTALLLNHLIMSARR